MVGGSILVPAGYPFERGNQLLPPNQYMQTVPFAKTNSTNSV